MVSQRSFGIFTLNKLGKMIEVIHSLVQPPTAYRYILASHRHRFDPCCDPKSYSNPMAPDTSLSLSSWQVRSCFWMFFCSPSWLVLFFFRMAWRKHHGKLFVGRDGLGYFRILLSRKLFDFCNHFSLIWTFTLAVSFFCNWGVVVYLVT